MTKSMNELKQNHYEFNLKMRKSHKKEIQALKDKHQNVIKLMSESHESAMKEAEQNRINELDKMNELRRSLRMKIEEEGRKQQQQEEEEEEEDLSTSHDSATKEYITAPDTPSVIAEKSLSTPKTTLRRANEDLDETKEDNSSSSLNTSTLSSSPSLNSTLKSDSPPFRSMQPPRVKRISASLDQPIRSGNRRNRTAKTTVSSTTPRRSLNDSMNTFSSSSPSSSSSRIKNTRRRRSRTRSPSPRRATASPKKKQQKMRQN